MSSLNIFFYSVFITAIEILKCLMNVHFATAVGYLKVIKHLSKFK